MTPLQLHVRSIVAFLVTVGTLIAGGPAASAQDNPLEPLDSSSPRATYLSFVDQVDLLEELLEEYESNRTRDTQQAFTEAIADVADLFDLSEVASANLNETIARSFSSLADILNRIPPPDVEEIPDLDAVEEADAAEIVVPGLDEIVAPGQDTPVAGGSGITTYTLPGSEITIRRIEEGERSGSYVFSADTVANLPTWREAVDDLPVGDDVEVSDWVAVEANFTGHLLPRSLVDALPDTADRIVLGSPLWKLLADVVVLAAIGAATWLWRRLVATRHAPGTVAGYALRLTTPVGFVLALTVARRFMDEQINHSGDVANIINLFVTAGIWVGFAWAFWLLARLVVEWIVATPAFGDRAVDRHLLRLLGKVVSVAGALGILWIGLSRIGISTVGLGVGAGVLGLAVGLAATGTLENLIGGITVYADRPFAVGQWIRVDDDFGEVEEIGPRSTSIRKLDDTRITLPNADISKLKITNYSERRHIQFLHVVGVRYETTGDQLRAIVAGVDARFREHPRVVDRQDSPRVVVIGFGASSIDIEVRAEVETIDFADFQRVQQELLLSISEIVDAAGSGFAFPSTTTYLAEDGGLPAPSDDAVPARPGRAAGPPASAVRAPTMPDRDEPDDVDDTDDVGAAAEESESV